MDSGGHDIPRQRPKTALSLRTVGVRREAIPVLVIDPFGGEDPVQLSCAIEAQVGLDSERRGIHVSRIGDLLAQLSGKVFPSVTDYAAELLDRLLRAQNGQTGSVTVEGVLTYFERVSGVKEKGSLEHLTLHGHVSGSGGRTSASAGIGFNHITACPCVQETYRHSFSSDTRSSRGRKLQLITHTQRCRTRINLINVKRYPTLPDLLGAIDAVAVRSQNTLPREFELLNVYRSHAEPQFLEDVLRELLRAVYDVVRPLSSKGELEISSVSMESIHDFDMHGEIAFPLKELDKAFRHRVSGGSINGKKRVRPEGPGLRAVAQKAGRKNPGRLSQKKRSPQGHSNL
jgi:GTP cyclohydrolase-4